MATSPEIRGPAVPTAASHSGQRPLGIAELDVTGGPPRRTTGTAARDAGWMPTSTEP